MWILEYTRFEVNGPMTTAFEGGHDITTEIHNHYVCVIVGKALRRCILTPLVTPF